MAIKGANGYAVDTTIVAGITATALKFDLTDKTNWPKDGADKFIVKIGSEYILCVRRDGVTVTVDPAGRGYNSTTAATHAAGAAVSALGYQNIRSSDEDPTVLPDIKSPNITGVIGSGGAAPTIASATTIAPTTDVVFVSGTTDVVNITPPAPIALHGGTLIIIPTGIFHTTNAGNIAIATTAVVSKAIFMTYDPTTAKWYPSY